VQHLQIHPLPHHYHHDQFLLYLNIIVNIHQHQFQQAMLQLQHHQLFSHHQLPPPLLLLRLQLQLHFLSIYAHFILFCLAGNIRVSRINE
jgi:hypothetical protein